MLSKTRPCRQCSARILDGTICDECMEYNHERRRYSLIARFGMCFVIAIVISLACADAFSQIPRSWDWTTDSDYHSAVVRVHQGNAGGTGTLIYAKNGRGVVLTASHVVAGNGLCTATWASGYSSRGRILARDSQADCAAFECVPPPDAVTIPILGAKVALPVPVELCGYGGPSKTLRHWTATVVSNDGRDLHTDTKSGALSGDSGGPCLYHVDGKGPAIIGIIEGSPQAYSIGLNIQGGDWKCHTPIRITQRSQIEKLVVQCFGGSCGPQQYAQPYQQQQQSPIEYVPPSTPIQRPDITPIQQPDIPIIVPEPEPVEIDYEKLADKLLEKMATDGRFVGTPGKDGVGIQGPPGANGQNAVVDIAAIVDQLPPIYPRWINKAGDVIDEIPDGVRLGQTMPLRIEVVIKEVENARTKSR